MDRSTAATHSPPEGSDRRPRDTLDRDTPAPVAPPTVPTAPTGDAPVVDEKGRPLSGDGLITADD
jgi:hypothetical protein